MHIRIRLWFYAKTQKRKGKTNAIKACKLFELRILLFVTLAASNHNKHCCFQLERSWYGSYVRVEQMKKFAKTTTTPKHIMWRALLFSGNPNRYPNSAFQINEDHGGNIKCPTLTFAFAFKRAELSIVIIVIRKSDTIVHNTFHTFYIDHIFKCLI